MPTYVQQCVACQHAFEDFRPIAQYDQNPRCPKCFNNTERLVTAAAVNKDNWDKPVVSEAMACDPADVPAREAMTGVKHTRDGRPIFNNAGERRRFMQKTGFHDRAAYFSSK